MAFIEKCLEQNSDSTSASPSVGPRRWRGPSGQIWTEVGRNDAAVIVTPEYPCGKVDNLTLPLRMLKQIGWIEIDATSQLRG